MAKYKFYQNYPFGLGWDGEIDVPDSAIFYNIKRDEKSEEWYILIPSNDINTLVKDRGCCQVRCYNLMDYTIVHLDNITTRDWPDIGKEEFDKVFDELFSNVYIYKYRQAEYQIKINNDATSIDDVVESKEVTPETLLACYRICSLSTGASVKCIRICVANMFNLTENYSMDITDFRLCDMQDKYSTDRLRTVVSDNSTLYMQTRLQVINHLI